MRTHKHMHTPTRRRLHARVRTWIRACTRTCTHKHMSHMQMHTYAQTRRRHVAFLQQKCAVVVSYLHIYSVCDYMLMLYLGICCELKYNYNFKKYWITDYDKNVFCAYWYYANFQLFNKTRRAPHSMILFSFSILH